MLFATDIISSVGSPCLNQFHFSLQLSLRTHVNCLSIAYAFSSGDEEGPLRLVFRGRLARASFQTCVFTRTMVSTKCLGFRNAWGENGPRV